MAKDIFSSQSEYYAQYRSGYTEEIYQHILKHVQNRNIAWDCGTGNGQVAYQLAGYFKKVYATDISSRQISLAKEKDNIEFIISDAENTPLPDNSINLITVAQALHWFDLTEFYKEVRRVSAPGGVITAWGYGLFRSDKKINNMMDDFYFNTIGPYWEPERKYIDEHYSNIIFPFNEIDCPDFSTELQWTLSHLEGYLNSWSSVQHFKEKEGYNPVEDLIRKLSKFWARDETKVLKQPVFMRLGVVE